MEISPRSMAIWPPSIAPPRIMIPPISLSEMLAIGICGIAFSRTLKPISDVGNHPTIKRSNKANIKNRLQIWGFLSSKNNSPKKTNTMTQFSGSIQNCTTLEKIKKIVSIFTQDLKPLIRAFFNKFLQLVLI